MNNQSNSATSFPSTPSEKELVRDKLQELKNMHVWELVALNYLVETGDSEPINHDGAKTVQKFLGGIEAPVWLPVVLKELKITLDLPRDNENRRNELLKNFSPKFSKALFFQIWELELIMNLHYFKQPITGNIERLQKICEFLGTDKHSGYITYDDICYLNVNSWLGQVLETLYRARFVK